MYVEITRGAFMKNLIIKDEYAVAHAQIIHDRANNSICKHPVHIGIYVLAYTHTIANAPNY